MTYSTRITLTEQTGRLMLAEINTMSAYMRSLEALTHTGNTDRKLIVNALSEIQMRMAPVSSGSPPDSTGTDVGAATKQAIAQVRASGAMDFAQ